MRRQDVGLQTHLDQLDRQISALQLDVRRGPGEAADSDSRPSSGTAGRRAHRCPGPRVSTHHGRIRILSMLVFKCDWEERGASQRALVVKNPPANAGDTRDAGSIPGLGRSPGGGHGNPLRYSCLENPMDKGAWWATVPGVAQSRTRLSVHGRKEERVLCALFSWENAALGEETA